MTLAIVVAMLEEIQPIRDLLQVETIQTIGHIKIEKAQYKGEDIYLVESGIGKANAAQGASLAIDRYQPRTVLNFGVVGSLVDSLGLGDLLIGDDFIYHDADETAFGSPYGRIPRMPVSYPIDPKLEPILDQLLQAESDFHLEKGQVLTSDSFTDDPKRIQWIKDTFPEGKVLEMEATAIAQVAYTHDVPFLSIKTISDEAGEMGPEEYERTKDQAAKNAVSFLLKALDLLVASDI